MKDVSYIYLEEMDIYMGESSLSVLFKTVCKMTVVEYVRLRRLSLASEELVSSNTPIVQLAYKYGYEFYYENAEKDSEYYKIVEEALEKK